MPINTYNSYISSSATQRSQAEADKNLVSRWEIITRRIAINETVGLSNSALRNFSTSWNAMEGYQSFQLWIKGRYSNTNSSNTVKQQLLVTPRWISQNGTSVTASSGRHGTYNWGVNQKQNGTFVFNAYAAHPGVNTNGYALYAGSDKQTTICISGMIDHGVYVNSPCYHVEQTWYSGIYGVPLRSTSTMTFNSLNTNINTWRFVGVNIGSTVSTNNFKYVAYLLGSRTGNT